MTRQPVLVLTGPTGTGKTDWAVHLAEQTHAVPRGKCLLNTDQLAGLIDQTECAMRLGHHAFEKGQMIAKQHH